MGNNKMSLSISIKNMRTVITKTKTTFFILLVLILIPVLIINCYSFYSVYGKMDFDYSKIEQIDFIGALNGGSESLEELYNKFNEAMPELNETEPNAADVTLEIFNYIISIFTDTFLILLFSAAVLGKKLKNDELAKLTAKRMFVTLLFSLISTWIFIEAQDILLPNIIMISFASRINGGILLPASIIALILSIVLSMLLVCWLMSFVLHMTIAAVNGRTRSLLAFGYARELLRGKVWKYMLHIAPFMIAVFLVPTLLQGTAVIFAQQTVLSISLVALSVIINVVANAYTWAYLVPDFFFLEKDCGIQMKIKEMIDNAMRNAQNIKRQNNSNEMSENPSTDENENNTNGEQDD